MIAGLFFIMLSSREVDSVCVRPVVVSFAMLLQPQVSKRPIKVNDSGSGVWQNKWLHLTWIQPDGKQVSAFISEAAGFLGGGSVEPHPDGGVVF